MTLPLDSVIANEELGRRPARPAGDAALVAALEKLARQLASSPRRVLQALTDTALELCRAHSAGVSLLEREGERNIFRWHAVSGQWAPLLWTTLPREFSPCGTVLDRAAPQLMQKPARHFTPMEAIAPAVEEVLLIPFSVGRTLVGTVWVIAHDASRRFDAEDHRVVSQLAEFAAAAYERLSSLSGEDIVQLSRLHKMHAVNDVPRAAVQKRVLIVDDHADSASSLAAVLATMGHQTRVAHDGLAALEAASRMRPDIVLLDIAMPGMTGFEVARELRQRLGAAVRIVALSGFGDETGRVQSIEAGCDQYLVKPVDPSFLKSLLG